MKASNLSDLLSAMGRLRQFNRMQAVFHAMHSGIEQSVSGLSGRAAIGITICWMSGIGRGSRIDSRSRATQISLQLTGSHKRTATHIQGDLLVTALADNRKLMEALDNLNSRYGLSAVKVST